jgi:hypothetical protein
MGPGFESQRDHEKPPFKEAFFVYIIQNSVFERLIEVSMHFGKSKKSKDTTKSTANQPAEF